jgi:hypothetical protein
MRNADDHDDESISLIHQDRDKIVPRASTRMNDSAHGTA